MNDYDHDVDLFRVKRRRNSSNSTNSLCSVSQSTPVVTSEIHSYRAKLVERLVLFIQTRSVLACE